MKSLAQNSLNKFSILPDNFYLRNSESVAKDLLGKYLVRHLEKKVLIAKIVETEAYQGAKDPASHAYRGPTPRNKAMFETGGICYIYRSYGIHLCMNVVTEKKGLGEAVLIRAAEPISEVGLITKNRGLIHPAKPKSLLSGPGKLCQGLGIGIDLNFHSFAKPPLQICFREKTSDFSIHSSPRIGISKAKDALLRFCIQDSVFVSKL